MSYWCVKFRHLNWIRSDSVAGTLAVNAAVVLAILLWDHMLMLPEERNLYGKSEIRQRHPLASWAFICLRYSALISTVAGLFYASFNISHCQVVVSIGQGAAIAVLASAGVIMCARVGAFWDYADAPFALALVACVSMVGSWIGVSTRFRASAGPDVAFGGNCRLHSLPPWTSAGPAAIAAFNCTILGLVFTRMCTQGTLVISNTGFTLINRACLLYLVCATGSSIAIAILYSINWHDDDLIRRLSASYSVLFMTTMGSRIFLNMQLHNQVLTRVAESNLFTASTWNDEAAMPQPTPLQETDSGFESAPGPTGIQIQRSIDTFSMNSGPPKTLHNYSTHNTLSAPPRSIATSKDGGSIKSSSSHSTRRTDYYGTPRSPRSVRGGGSVKSYATSQHSGSGSARRNGTLANPSSRRSTRKGSLMVESTLPATENLKSTWIGV
ncbi:hypothetical protein CPC08DRAFT_232890 [Agrocybe pediades]|nr:hypothetical protein CPC08DRAFT_232890 [Agrocybe pediades]